MRFGIMAAAAAALVCAGQAEAARYYEFEMKATAYLSQGPSIGGRLQSYGLKTNYKFVFDTMNPESGAIFAARGFSDNIFMNVSGNSEAFIYDLPTPDGPDFSFRVNLVNISYGETLSPLSLDASSFSYLYRVDPRYSVVVNATAGKVTSLMARASDIAPSYTGLIGRTSFTAVPETATWVMMIGGMGMIGGAMRRRKSKVTTKVTFA